jgi:Bifunctional DNA primase/polymerase, N-terminal
VLDAALDYAVRGWPVLPIAVRGKVPITAHGLKDATTDLDVIREWWSRTPNANVGIRTDEFVVVDCDGPIGKRNWLDFIAGVGFTSSPYAWTGGGGLHIWYRRDGHPVRNRAGWLEHVDVRSEGGYVIVPPSVHPSGADYYWEVGPDERAVPRMPARLLEALAVRHAMATPSFTVARSIGEGYVRAAFDAELERVRTAPVGTRNATLVAAAFNLGQLVASGKLAAGVVAGQLLAAATTAGLDTTEALHTVQSGMTAGLSKPRSR